MKEYRYMNDVMDGVIDLMDFVAWWTWWVFLLKLICFKARGRVGGSRRTLLKKWKNDSPLRVLVLPKRQK